MAETSSNASDFELVPDPNAADPAKLLTAIDALRTTIRLQGPLSTQDEQESIFGKAVQPLLQMVPFDVISFLLFGNDQIDIDLAFVHPEKARIEAEGNTRLLIEGGSFARALRQGRPLLVSTPETESDLDHLLCPLLTADGIRGMFCGSLSSKAKPNEEMLSLVEIALASVAVALENNLVHGKVKARNRDLERQEEDLRQSFENFRAIMNGTIQTIATIAELRDPYTSGHQERVSRLGRAIARILGLPEEEVEGVRVAGALHDVGKMQIPTEILCKPGRVTEIEMMLLRTHAQAGFDILAGITFPWPVAEIVLQHHERMDGSGYPRGIRGEDTLLEARILAVADVVEAMASHRPYRPALGIDKALAEIRRGRETVYDPEVVDACLQVFDEGLIEL